MTKYSYGTLGSSTSMLADKCSDVYIPLTNQTTSQPTKSMEKSLT